MADLLAYAPYLGARLQKLHPQLVVCGLGRDVNGVEAGCNTRYMAKTSQTVCQGVTSFRLDPNGDCTADVYYPVELSSGLTRDSVEREKNGIVLFPGQ